jgi:L-threonylcarbamoyladenylate synthase
MLRCEPFTLFFLPFTIDKEMADKTKILKIDPQLIEPVTMSAIVGILQKGGVIAYPTDTFYGLGANCFLKKAIQRIYYLKRREPAKPLSALVSHRDMVHRLAVEVPSLFWDLTEQFWPGPLTLVVKASSDLPEEMLGPGESVGIRLPDVSWLQRLIAEADFPIIATSANISGEREIDDPSKIVDIFSGKVDLIVDGGRTGGILPSTVVDLSSSRPKILREGAVPRSYLERYFGKDLKS